MDEKVLKIFNKVYELSIAKKVDWKEGETDASFYCQIGDYLIEVYDSGFSSRFNVKGKGNVLLGDLSSNIITGKTTNPPISELFDIAKKIAFNIDENLDGLLNNLDQIDK